MPCSFWRAYVSSRSTSNPASNLPLYLALHSAPHGERAWVAPRGEVHEEGLVRHQRLLALHPGDRVVGQVLREVVPLLRRLRRLERGGALIRGRGYHWFVSAPTKP
jgi:hypothetical protein